MRELTVLLGLLFATNLVNNIFGSKLQASIDESFVIPTFHVRENIESCIVTRNGVNYSIYPISNYSHLYHSVYDTHNCDCHVNRVSFDDAGEWRITTTWINSNNKSQLSKTISVILYVVEKIDIRPTNIIIGRNGSYAIAYFEHVYDDITKCYIEDAKNESITYRLSGNGHNTSADLELHGKCGVRMPINSKWEKNWLLVQERSENRRGLGYFVVRINPEFHYEQVHKLWYIGSKQEYIKLESHANSDCELERPDGIVMSLNASKCIYKVKEVGGWHAGVWKARYLPQFSMNIVEQEIVIEVRERLSINVSVTTTNDKTIHVLCKSYWHVSNYCVFTKPNGTLIHSIPGIGNDKYEYFGLGYSHTFYSESIYAECGLTIRNPTSDDYGLWKCSLQLFVDYSYKYVSEFVRIGNKTEEKIERPYISTNQVYVKRGSDSIIKCTTKAPLQYCWFQSPNRTIYTVMKNDDAALNSLEYTGEGLSVGVCGAIIKNASDMHNGDWTCRLGIVGGTEVHSIVPVTVTDSDIRPLLKTINIAYNEPKLAVELLRSVEATIRYCRWIRPDGNGFHHLNNDQYQTFQNNTHCIFIIKELNDIDIGIWGCYAGLTIDSNKEIFTNIELVSSGSVKSYKTYYILTGCLFSIIIIGGALVYIVFKRRNGITKKVSSHNEFDASKHYSISLINDESNL